MANNYEKENFKICNDAECGCMVTVSCITFNHGRYIQKALEGFLNQRTDFDYEIIIHDDASTDGTADIIKKYSELYPDVIKPLFEEENQYSKGISNISGVFNFPKARGKYIAMCEGDDYWTDMDKLKKQVDFMEAHPDFSMCCHSAGIISADGAYRSDNAVRPFTGSRELKPHELISKKTNIPTASLFFRSAYARTLPEWYYNCPVGDIPLQLYMLLMGRVYYFDETMSMYRIGRAGSWQDLMDEGGREEFSLRWERHFSSMRDLYLSFDEDSSHRWHDAVSEALGRQRFLIDLKEGKAEAVLDPANALFLAELPFAERHLEALKARSPEVYSFIRSIYLKLKRNIL